MIDRFGGADDSSSVVRLEFTCLLLVVSTCFIALNLPYFVTWCLRISRQIQVREGRGWVGWGRGGVGQGGAGWGTQPALLCHVVPPHLPPDPGEGRGRGGEWWGWGRAGRVGRGRAGQGRAGQGRAGQGRAMKLVLAVHDPVKSGETGG